MIRIAIVGCGGMANWHASVLKNIPECKVVGLVDVDPKRTAEFKQKYFSDAFELSDYEQLFHHPPQPIDAVVLVTPHTLHYAQAKRALEAGLHVLCEKPMVTDSRHGYDLWKTVKATGKHLGITFQAPYCAEYQAIKKLRDSGQLGKPQLIQGWLAQGWLKATANTWRQDPALSGGGQMYDSGSHVLNGMMWIMNEPVVEVACLIDNLGAAVDINGVAIMRFKSGAMGSVAIGGNSPGWNVDIRLQTDRLQVRTGPHGGYLECHRHGKPFYPEVPFDESPSAFTPHLNFIRTLLGTEQPQAVVRHGVLLSVLMDAMYESARTQKPMKVEPVPDVL